MLDFVPLLEISIVAFIVFLGIVFILFSNDMGLVFLGPLLLIGATFIVYINHVKHLNHEFLIESFEASEKIECALWIGEHKLIDQGSGWRYNEGLGFVKGDTVFSAPGLCRVIGKEPPPPPLFPYMGVLLLSVVALFSSRALIQALIRKERGEDESD